MTVVTTELRLRRELSALRGVRDDLVKELRAQAKRAHRAQIVATQLETYRARRLVTDGNRGRCVYCGRVSDELTCPGHADLVDLDPFYTEGSE